MQSVAVILPHLLLYVPAGHCPGQESTNPALDEYLPGGQNLQSFGVVCANFHPYFPAGHGAVHVGKLSPGVDPYVPRGQGTHPSSR